MTKYGIFSFTRQDTLCAFRYIRSGWELDREIQYNLQSYVHTYIHRQTFIEPKGAAVICELVHAVSLGKRRRRRPTDAFPKSKAAL